MMNRLWIGIGLLAAILAIGLWTSARMTDIHSGIADTLDRSAQAAQSDQWDRAKSLEQEAADHWKRSWNFSAALADHTVLDEIDGLFAQSAVYLENRDGVSYAAVCAQLASAIEALHEGHKLSWWNLL